VDPCHPDYVPSIFAQKTPLIVHRSWSDTRGDHLLVSLLIHLPSRSLMLTLKNDTLLWVENLKEKCPHWRRNWNLKKNDYKIICLAVRPILF